MITSGLVLTLSSDPVQAGRARAALQARSELTLGQPSQRWLPLVAETTDVRAGRDLHEWLSGVPGVEFVDVVHVSFEESDPSSLPIP